MIYNYPLHYNKNHLHNFDLYSLPKSFPKEKLYKQNNMLESKPLKSNNNTLKEQYVFEIFGINLYFDDILIIFLIFFLYKEGVKDDYLFIALLLLLLN